MNAGGDGGRESEYFSRPEGQYFERKSSRVSPKDLANALIAFANAEGGIIVVGIHDGKLDGGLDEKAVNALRQVGVDHTYPPVRFDFQERSVPGGSVYVIAVEPSSRVHEKKNGDCYLRIGDESRKLSFDERLELEYAKGERQYDATVVDGAGPSELDETAVAEFAEIIGASDGVRALAGRYLAVDSGVTVAAVLLFGKDPQRYFQSAFVRVLKYEGTDRLFGEEQNLLEDHRIEGRIPDVIDEARDLVSRLLPRRKQLGSDGKFSWVPVYPEAAWLEGIVNAVLHRSYSIHGDHVRVEIFADRIEITSPGRFPGLADPRDPLRIARFARNPLIARSAIDLGYGQELGEGIRRIYHEMQHAEFRDPEYRQTSGSVTLILAALPRIRPELMEGMPARVREVLELMTARGIPMGTGEVAGDLSVSRPVASRALKALQEKGLVEWSGNSPNDPRATWSVSKKLL